MTCEHCVHKRLLVRPWDDPAPYLEFYKCTNPNKREIVCPTNGVLPCQGGEP